MARAKKTKNLGKLSLWQLKDAYDIENSSWAPKKRAEVEFALAVALKRTADELAEKFGPGFGDAEKSYRADARRYAHACVNALREMPNKSLQDIATQHTVLAGVALPNRFYYEYVLNHTEIRTLLGNAYG